MLSRLKFIVRSIFKSKYFISIISFTILSFAIGEILARYYLGLGTPPLSVADPTIEYLYQSNQNLYRFGHHFITNQYGMRSPPLATVKGSNEFRIMVFGDSVVNGGAPTDQSELATTLVQEKLSKKINKNVFVGNISAGSWGPGNWLEYAKKYGFFNADIVILILSSHDYNDNPTYAPLDPITQPTKQPISALMEGIQVYLPRLVIFLIYRMRLIRTIQYQVIQVR